MGVDGLWDILNKAGQSRALAYLAVVDGFESNISGKRAYRIGIDASIWYTHASFAKGGENPELRLLFFRLRHLAELPFLPLFVFDGRERPKIKRGSRMGKSGSHGLTNGFKQLLDCFGMEWRMARGEAEAEHVQHTPLYHLSAIQPSNPYRLAFLNSTGAIDAIMTDDADAFVFGATCVIKNVSATLTGNKNNPALNSEGKASKTHVMVYRSAAFQAQPETRISRAGLILYALLAGGDYAEGAPGFGTVIAHALARSGFGEQLMDAFERRTTMNIQPFLEGWRAAVHDELRHNIRGLLPRKYPSLQLPEIFPNMETMECYADPASSARYGGNGGGPLRGNGELSLPRIAAFCEEHFIEWGYERAIIKRFRDLIWPAVVMRLVRRAALEADERETARRIDAGRSDLQIRGVLRPKPEDGVGVPAGLAKRFMTGTVEDRRAAAFANREEQPQPEMMDADNRDPLLIKIVGSRAHVSTDYLLEHRVEVAPSTFVTLARSGIKGTHAEPADHGDHHHDPSDYPSQGASQPGPKTPKNPPPEPNSVLRLWLPASMVQQAHPALVKAFEASGKAGKSVQRRPPAQASNAQPPSGVRHDVEMQAPNQIPASLPESSSQLTPATQLSDPRASNHEDTSMATETSTNAGEAATPVGALDQRFQGSRLVRRLLHPSMASIPDLSVAGPPSLAGTPPPSSLDTAASAPFLFTMADPDDPYLVDTDTEPETDDEEKQLSMSVMEIPPSSSQLPMASSPAKPARRASPSVIELTDDEDDELSTSGLQRAQVDAQPVAGPSSQTSPSKSAQPSANTPSGSPSNTTSIRRRTPDEVPGQHDGSHLEAPPRSSFSQPNPASLTGGATLSRRQTFGNDVIEIDSDSDLDERGRVIPHQKAADRLLEGRSGPSTIGPVALAARPPWLNDDVIDLT